ncbi:MAG: type IIL restriction-modification enzyme MmeI [Sphingopyxis sp.]
MRTRFPEVYQHILQTVKPERDANRRDTYRKNWWIHGEPRKDLRPALAGLPRYIATVETAKHRIFQFLDAGILPDNMLIAIGSDDAFHHGVLSSTAHAAWALEIGGTLEDRPRYNKSQIFDPFPFPDATPRQRATIAELAEELDAARKAALAEVPGLTMTEIYNWRAKLQSGDKRSPADEDRATLDRMSAARAGIVHRLHEQIDAAVADAYGWAADLTPSDIVTRLVALNATRAAEEATGQIRWLRPEYQIPRFGLQSATG